MNEVECMAFLSLNQPLPPDTELSEEVAGQLDSVRKWLADNPIPQALPLLLRVFGEGDGFGVYPMIEDTLRRYPREAVIIELLAALQEAAGAARYWVLQFAASYPAECMAKPISDLLPLLDHDSRYAALTALESIGGQYVRTFLFEWSKKETDPELLDLLSDILKN